MKFTKILFWILVAIAILNLVPFLLDLIPGNSALEYSAKEVSLYFALRLGPPVSWLLGILAIYVASRERSQKRINWLLGFAIGIGPALLVFWNDQDFGAFQNMGATCIMLGLVIPALIFFAFKKQKI